MTGPRVSVLLPVHDAGSTLAEAIDSALAQTLADLELLVVLNGCTDDSAAIAASRAARDARVRLVELPEAGLVPALNAGLELARAPLVARHDADDVMHPERLARQVAALDAHPGWDVVACGVAYATLGDAAPGPGMQRFVAWLNALDTPEALRRARFIDAPVAHPSVVFRRRAVLEAGGYRDGDFPEDHELWLRLFERGAVFGKVPDVLQTWRDHPRRLTRADARYRELAFRRLRHAFLLSGPLAGGRACRLWGAGEYGRRHAAELLDAGARVDDLIDIDPRKIGQRSTRGLPVVAHEALGPPDGRLVLLCVASRGARELIVPFLEARGYRPERDWLPLQ